VPSAGDRKMNSSIISHLKNIRNVCKKNAVCLFLYRLFVYLPRWILFKSQNLNIEAFTIFIDGVQGRSPDFKQEGRVLPSDRHSYWKMRNSTFILAKMLVWLRLLRISEEGRV